MMFNEGFSIDTYEPKISDKRPNVLRTMKKVIFFLFVLVATIPIMAQVPQSFHYQMVVRNGADQLVRNQMVGLRLSVQSVSNGVTTTHYQETQQAMSDDNAYISVMVGRGTVVLGSFVAIPWGQYDTIQLYAEADPTGGTAYTLSASQQLVVVPYAFLSQEFQNLDDVSSLGNSAGNRQLKSVQDPTEPQDVITKYYLDSVISEIMRRSVVETREAHYCITPGGSVSVYDTTYAIAGVYQRRLERAGTAGVDSLITIIVTVGNGTHNAISAGTCNTYVWAANGQEYNEAGSYVYNYADANGCLSADTLHLTLLPSTSSNPRETICSASLPYTWNGYEFTHAGTHTETLQAANGCDSVVNMTLVVKYAYAKTDSRNICPSQLPYVWNGYEFTAAGNHSVMLHSIYGCDSNVTMYLTVLSNTSSDTTATPCTTSFTWYGTEYTESDDYSRTLTNAMGCDSTIYLHLTLPTSVLSLSATPTHATCYGQTGSVSLLADGGHGSYTYSTSRTGDFAAASTISDLAAGSYKFFVRDIKGCLDSTTTTITSPAEVMLTINTTNVTCPGRTDGTISLGATGGSGNGYSYYVSNTRLLGNDTIGLAAQVYTEVYAKDGANCESEHTSVTVNSNPALVVTAGNDVDYCQGASTETTLAMTTTGGSAPYTYHWTASDELTADLPSDLTTASITVTPTASNQYTLTVTDNAGCTGNATVSININSLPTLVVSSKTDADCHGTGSVTLGATGGNGSYEFKQGSSGTYDEGNTFGSLAPGDYTFYVRDSKGCVDNESVNIGALPTLAMNISLGSSICPGGSASLDTISVNGGTRPYNTFVWTSNTDADVANIGSVNTAATTVSPTATTLYSLTITDATGCTATSYVTVSLYSAPSITVSATPASVCLGNATTLSSSTSNTISSYSWTSSTAANVANISSATTSSTSASPTQSTRYYLTATDEHGCLAIDSIDVSVTSCAVYGTKEVVACDTYTWMEGGDEVGTYTSSTNTPTYTFVGGAASGADSVVTLNLTINHSTTVDSAADRCSSFSWYGNDYTSSGNYTHTTTKQNGCDSIVSLTLNIATPINADSTAIACESFSWYGSSYTESGSYTHVVHMANGCDSTVSLTLTINSASNVDSVAVECDEFSWYGTTYYASGSYTHNVSQGGGCDNVVNLTLTIKHSSTPTTDVQRGCDSYIWPANSQTYTSTNASAAQVTLVNAVGCDSVVTLNVTIYASTSSNETVEVCGTLGTYNGTRYAATHAGAHYALTSINSDGCVHTINLTVYDRNDEDLSGLRVDTVCSGANSITVRDTLFFENFDHSIPYGNGETQWKQNTYGSPAFNWDLFSDLYGHYDWNYGDGGDDHNFFGQPGDQFSYSAMNNGYNISWAWSPRINISNPATTYIDFYWANWAWQGNTDGIYVGFSTNRTANTTGVWAVATEDASGWRHVNQALSSLSAGNYYIKFMHQSWNGDGSGVDNVLVYSDNTYNLTGTTVGDNYEINVTYNAYGCPVTGRIIHKRAQGLRYNVDVCDNEYTWVTRGGSWHYTSNQTNVTKTYTLGGCSVTDTLTLTLNTSVGNRYSVSSSSNYVWPTSGSKGHGTGSTYPSSGTYVGRIYMKGACLVTDTLDLIIDHSSCTGSRFEQVVCDSYTWPTSGGMGNGSGETETSSGVYVGPSYSRDECPSLVDTLDLTVNSSASSTDIQWACDELTWIDGHRYTSSTNTPAHSLLTSKGCDSVITLNLTIANSNRNKIEEALCNSDSYSWHDVDYSEVGTYTYQEINAQGCMDYDTLVLTDSRTVQVIYDTLCAGDPLITYDTIMHEGFDVALQGDWQTFMLCSQLNTGFARSESLYGFTPYAGSQQVSAPSTGAICWGSPLGYASNLQAINMMWSPQFTVTDPANTYVTAYMRNPAYQGVSDVLRLLIVDNLNVNLSGVTIANFNTPHNDWTMVRFSLAGISAGSYRIKLMQQDNDGYGVFVDNITVYRQTSTDMSQYTPGETIYSTDTTVGANGCRQITGSAIYIQGGGTVTTVSTCDPSYTWRIGGQEFVYTETGIYEHTYQASGCNITDQLNLTIHQPTEVVYNVNNVGPYTWHTDDINGKGTGLTYTQSGTYYGRYHNDSNGCPTRDRLNLTIH